MTATICPDITAPAGGVASAGRGVLAVALGEGSDREDIPLCHGQGDLMQSPDPATQNTARYLCLRCPTMLACRAWALRTHVDGVCGAMTATERDAWREFTRTPHPIPDVTPGDERVLVTEQVRAGSGGRNPAVVALIDRLSQHLSTEEVADRLGITRRTVTRYRSHSRQNGGPQGPAQ